MVWSKGSRSIWGHMSRTLSFRVRTTTGMNRKEIRFYRRSRTSVRSTSSRVLPLKTGHRLGSRIATKIYSHAGSIVDLVGNSKSGVWYHDGPTYWIRVLPFEPTGNQSDRSSHYHHLKGKDDSGDTLLFSFLISSVFYFHFKICSNCRDFGVREVELFRFPKSLLKSDLRGIVEKLSGDLWTPQNYAPETMRLDTLSITSITQRSAKT